MNISLYILHIKKEKFEEYMNDNNKDEYLEYIEVKKYIGEVLKYDLQKEIKILDLKKYLWLKEIEW